MNYFQIDFIFGVWLRFVLKFLSQSSDLMVSSEKHKIDLRLAWLEIEIYVMKNIDVT